MYSLKRILVRLDAPLEIRGVVVTSVPYHAPPGRVPVTVRTPGGDSGVEA